MTCHVRSVFGPWRFLDAAPFDSQRQAFRAQIKLLNVLHVIRPKLRIRVQLVPPQRIADEIKVVFDPALQKVEATVCPECAPDAGTGVEALQPGGVPGVRCRVTSGAQGKE
jgi:hypothetical protein